MQSSVKSPAKGEKKPRPRGRPRSAEAREAILRAASELLEEGGPTAVTIEAVAARAGVGRPTIYRSWPNRDAVVMAALMATAPPETPVPQAGGALEALQQQLRSVANVFSTRTGRNVATMIATAESETELAKAFRHYFILARRNEGRLLLERAVQSGEVRPDIDVEVVLDLIYGPIFYRLLIGHAGLETAFTDSILSHVMRGLATSRGR